MNGRFASIYAIARTCKQDVAGEGASPPRRKQALDGAHAHYRSQYFSPNCRDEDFWSGLKKGGGEEPEGRVKGEEGLDEEDGGGEEREKSMETMAGCSKKVGCCHTFEKVVDREKDR
jgi:hypothetical protein